MRKGKEKEKGFGELWLGIGRCGGENGRLM